MFRKVRYVGFVLAAALAGALFLFVPGALVLVGLRMHVASAIAFAPLLGIPATIALCLAYAALGINTNWATIFFPQLVVGLIICIVGRVRARDLPRRRFGERSREACRFDLCALALYLLVGIVVSVGMFTSFLGDPSNYMQEYDNVSHLGSIRCFVETGNWSPFSTSLYAGAADAAINPLPGGGFYPTAWYNVAAFMVSLLDVPIPLSENAANFVFVALALPASMFAFMRIVFQERRDIVCWGAACAPCSRSSPDAARLGPAVPEHVCLLPAAARGGAVRGDPAHGGFAPRAHLRGSAVRHRRHRLGARAAERRVRRGRVAHSLLHLSGGNRGPTFSVAKARRNGGCASCSRRLRPSLSASSGGWCTTCPS